LSEIKPQSGLQNNKDDGDLSILVVDDNATNQQLLSSQLKLLGFAAEIASNGQDGVEKWQQKKYNIVLADCSMPVLNGFEMTKQIRNLESASMHINNKTLIIAITGAPEEYKDQCFEAGMDDIIGKPMLLNDLRKVLHKHKPEFISSISS